MNRIFVNLRRTEESYIGDRFITFENHLHLNQIGKDYELKDKVHLALKIMSDKLDWYEYKRS